MLNLKYVHKESRYEKYSIGWISSRTEIFKGFKEVIVCWDCKLNEREIGLVRKSGFQNHFLRTSFVDLMLAYLDLTWFCNLMRLLMVSSLSPVISLKKKWSLWCSITWTTLHLTSGCFGLE